MAAQRRLVARAAERRARRSRATGSAGPGGGGGDRGLRGSAPASEHSSAALASRQAPPPSPPRAGVRWSLRPRPPPPPSRRGECGLAGAPGWGRGGGATRRPLGRPAAREPGRLARAAALPGRKCGALCGRPGAAPRRQGRARG